MYKIVYYFAVLLTTCQWFEPRLVRVNIKPDPMLTYYTSPCLENGTIFFFYFSLSDAVKSLPFQEEVSYLATITKLHTFYITLLFFDFLCIFGGEGRSVYVR